MKRLALIPMLLALITTPLAAQKFSNLDKSPADIAAYPSKYNVSDKLVRVIYSRPQLKKRDLANLIPVGKVWRTGANEASEITFYKDAKIGNKSIAAGTYSLFTIPRDEEWTIVLNKNLNQWGAYSYDSAADVVRFNAKEFVSQEENLEAFSMAFKEADGGVHLIMGWGTMRLTTPKMTFY